jgi:hypothetical protein
MSIIHAVHFALAATLIAFATAIRFGFCATNATA